MNPPLSQPWLDRLRPVAQALGPLREEVVFVGGSVLPLQISDPAVTDLRPTLDVDVIIEVASRSAYADLETQLRQLGFTHDRSEGAPICRWVVAETIVDVMPTDPDDDWIPWDFWASFEGLVSY